jgi:hypothetical protein
MKTNVSYCKETDDYEVGDYYGETMLDIPTVKKLLRLIKKTHPELLEKIK